VNFPAKTSDRRESTRVEEKVVSSDSAVSSIAVLAEIKAIARWIIGLSVPAATDPRVGEARVAARLPSELFMTV
jgi:hypothetical protein